MVPNFIVHIKYDLVKRDFGGYRIPKFTGTSGGKYLSKYQTSGSAYPDFNGNMVHSFDFTSAEYDGESESKFPEGTNQFNIWIGERRSHYQSSYWVWNKTRGWGWGDTVKEECFRIKGKP